MNFLGTFNHLERVRIEPRNDPMENLLVPAGESFSLGGIWVAEFFPPSRYERLRASLERNGWERDRMSASIDASKAEQVWRARRGRGFAWSRIASITNPNSGYVGAGLREPLPKEFDFIDISAVQLGSSVTAVVAYFKLSECGRSAINEVWTGKHEPMLVWRGKRRPHVEDRYFSALISTQTERQRLHDLARKWLSDRCPGYFAQTELGQPVVDFGAFAIFDPCQDSDSQAHGEPQRSLGVEGNHLYRNLSPQMPGGVIVQGDPLRRENERLSNSWSVIGKLETLRASNERDGYGSKPFSVGTLASMFDDAVGGFLLYVASFSYANQLREALSEARDSARARHRRFSPRQVERLRVELLSTSLDIPVVSRDAALVFAREGRWWRGISVKAVPVAGIPNPPEEYDLIGEMGSRTRKMFKALTAEDAAYRDVLSTVSSLGSSAAETRLSRRALAIAGASLVVALVALLVAPEDPSLWERVLDLINTGG